jgi:hypothetical protein
LIKDHVDKLLVGPKKKRRYNGKQKTKKVETTSR